MLTSETMSSPRTWATISWSTKAWPIWIWVASSASVNWVFWKCAIARPKALPLLHVGDRVVEGAPAGPHRRHADREPLLLELVHHHLEALPFLAEQVLGRDAAVLEEELARVLRGEAELLELPAAHEAGRVGFDEQQADPLCAGLRARVGLHGDDEEAAELADRDEGLGAVHDVVVAVADGTGLDVGEVRAGAGLGHADPEEELAATAGGMYFLFCASVPKVTRYGRQIDACTVVMIPCARM